MATKQQQKPAAKAVKRETTYTREQLDAMTVPELEKIAKERKLAVTSSAGDENDPSHDDYVQALSVAKGASRPDETVPGGHYIKSDGRHVNAEGKELDEDGNIIEGDE